MVKANASHVNEMKTPINDLRDDEQESVLLIANELAHARIGKEYDEWDWIPVLQVDVDRARWIVNVLNENGLYREEGTVIVRDDEWYPF